MRVPLTGATENTPWTSQLSLKPCFFLSCLCPSLPLSGSIPVIELTASMSMFLKLVPTTALIKGTFYFPAHCTYYVYI